MHTYTINISGFMENHSHSFICKLHVEYTAGEWRVAFTDKCVIYTLEYNIHVLITSTIIDLASLVVNRSTEITQMVWLGLL